MHILEFDYELPEELIAQRPSEKRENSKMMVLDRENRQILHKNFFNIVDYLDENCVLILNNTKVMPARLYGYKDTGAKIEVFLLKKYDQENRWEVLIRPSKRVRPGTVIKVPILNNTIINSVYKTFFLISLTTNIFFTD